MPSETISHAIPSNVSVELCYFDVCTVGYTTTIELANQSIRNGPEVVPNGHSVACALRRSLQIDAGFLEPTGETLRERHVEQLEAVLVRDCWRHSVAYALERSCEVDMQAVTCL